MRPRLRGSWLVVVGALAAGCTGQAATTGDEASHEQHARPHDTDTVPAPPQPIDGPGPHFDTQATAADLAHATVAQRGWFVTAERRRDASPHDSQSLVMAVGDDGSVALAETSDHGELLVADSNGKVSSVPGTQDAQIRYVDLSRDWVVWTSSDSASYFQDPWVLYAYNRHTGAHREIARAPKVDGSGYPTAPEGSVPELAGDAVVMATAVGVDGRRTVADVMAYPLDGGPARRLVADAITPHVVGDTLTYVRAGWGFIGYQVHRRQLDRPSTDQLIATGRSRLTGVAAARDWTAWQDSTGTWMRSGHGARTRVLDHAVLRSITAAGSMLIGTIPGPHGATVVAIDTQTGQTHRLPGKPSTDAPRVSGSWVVRDQVGRRSVTSYLLGRLPEHG